MQIFKQVSKFNFMSKRHLAMVLSLLKFRRKIPPLLLFEQMLFLIMLLLEQVRKIPIPFELAILFSMIEVLV